MLSTVRLAADADQRLVVAARLLREPRPRGTQSAGREGVREADDGDDGGGGRRGAGVSANQTKSRSGVRSSPGPPTGAYSSWLDRVSSARLFGGAMVTFDCLRAFASALRVVVGSTTTESVSPTKSFAADRSSGSMMMKNRAQRKPM